MSDQERNAAGLEARQDDMQIRHQTAARDFEMAAAVSAASRDAARTAPGRDPDRMVRFMADRMEDGANASAKVVHEAGAEINRLGDNVSDARHHRAMGVQQDDLSGTRPHIEKAEPGKSYAGPVVEVTDKHIHQRLRGDSGTLIHHDRQSVSGDVRVGKDMDISYPHGRAGIAKDLERAGPEDRQLDMQKPQHSVDRER